MSQCLPLCCLVVSYTLLSLLRYRVTLTLVCLGPRGVSEFRIFSAQTREVSGKLGQVGHPNFISQHYIISKFAQHSQMSPVSSLKNLKTLTWEEPKSELYDVLEDIYEVIYFLINIP